MDVKRYKLLMIHNYEPERAMFEKPDGDYVRFDAYDRDTSALRAEIDTLRAANAAQSELIADLERSELRAIHGRATEEALERATFLADRIHACGHGTMALDGYEIGMFLRCVARAAIHSSPAGEPIEHAKKESDK